MLLCIFSDGFKNVFKFAVRSCNWTSKVILFFLTCMKSASFWTKNGSVGLAECFSCICHSLYPHDWIFMFCFLFHFRDWRWMPISLNSPVSRSSVCIWCYTWRQYGDSSRDFQVFRLPCFKWAVLYKLHTKDSLLLFPSCQRIRCERGYSFSSSWGFRFWVNSCLVDGNFLP